MENLLLQVWQDIHKKSEVPQPAGLVAAAFYEKFQPSQTELLYIVAHLLAKVEQ